MSTGITNSVGTHARHAESDIPFVRAKNGPRLPLTQREQMNFSYRSIIHYLKHPRTLLSCVMILLMPLWEASEASASFELLVETGEGALDIRSEPSSLWETASVAGWNQHLQAAYARSRPSAKAAIGGASEPPSSQTEPLRAFQ